MSQAPSMPLFPDAFIADTQHLSLEERGAYMHILMVTWRNNGRALPDDPKRMARTLAVTVPRWEKLRPVLAEFFDLSGGTWRQKRLEKEWQFVQKSQAISRCNGAKGGRPKILKNNNTQNPAGSFQANLNETTQPQPLTQRKKEIEAAASIEKKPARGHRLPDGWQPPDKDQREAREALGGVAQERAEFDKLVDWAKAAAGGKGVKSDWTAFYRNWMRSAAERTGGTNGTRSHHRPGNRPVVDSPFLGEMGKAAVARQLERHDARPGERDLFEPDDR